MPETQNIRATADAASEHDQSSDPRPSSSVRAAAIEAAYILEAVRK
jgi:hypothetical protein